MSLTRANALGWADKDLLTPVQINHIDAELPKAIDGVLGGSYSPTSPIVLTGNALNAGPNAIKLVGTSQISLDNRSLSRSGLRCVPLITDSAIWTPPSNTDVTTNGVPPFAMKQASVANQHETAWEVDLPHGATLTLIGVLLKGAAAHVGLPAFMPTISLKSYNTNTGVLSVIFGPQNDTSATTAAYQAVHQVAITGISYTVDAANNIYYLIITGESGANALTGLVAYGPTATATFATQQEW